MSFDDRGPEPLPNHTMKKMIVGGLAAGTVALGLAVAGPANATIDPSPFGGGYLGDQNAYAYMVEMDGLGTGYNAAEAKDFGVTMCRAMSNGASQSDIIGSGVGFGISRAAATLAIRGAEFHFCPGYFREEEQP